MKHLSEEDKARDRAWHYHDMTPQQIKDFIAALQCDLDERDG